MFLIGLHTVLYGIDSAVGHFDHLVQSDEGSLKWSQFDQQGDCLLEILFQLWKLLTAPSQTCKLVCVTAILIALKDGQIDTWKEQT